MVYAKILCCRLNQFTSFVLYSQYEFSESNDTPVDVCAEMTFFKNKNCKLLTLFKNAFCDILNVLKIPLGGGEKK